MGKVRFSLTGNNLDEFTFKVERRNHVLIFMHKNIEVSVSGFKLVDWNNWQDRQYPAVENGIVQYLFQAEVNAKVGNTGVKGTITLGHPVQRANLLAALGRGREQEIIDTLLLKIDRVAGAIFPIETTSGAHPKHPEDARSRIKEF
jgi:hypothetical protein